MIRDGTGLALICDIVYLPACLHGVFVRHVAWMDGDTGRWVAGRWVSCLCFAWSAVVGVVVVVVVVVVVSSFAEVHQCIAGLGTAALDLSWLIALA